MYRHPIRTPFLPQARTFGTGGFSPLAAGLIGAGLGYLGGEILDGPDVGGFGYPGGFGYAAGPGSYSGYQGTPGYAGYGYQGIPGYAGYGSQVSPWNGSYGYQGNPGFGGPGYYTQRPAGFGW